MAWEASSHVGSELELGHTQVIFPTVQDDSGLEGAHQGVWINWVHVKSGGVTTGLKELEV